VQTCQVDPATGCTKWVNTSTCETNQVCTGAGQCSCSATTASCSGACVDLQTNVSNCGSCGNNCATQFMGCSGGQCACTPTTPNGTPCLRPGEARGTSISTCWGGRCVLAQYAGICNSDADCVPGGCTGPNGGCLGTAEVAGQVGCTNTDGEYVVCPASQGCSHFGGRFPPFVSCGDGAGGTGAITCDGPNDCPGDSDCCPFPSTLGFAQCTPRTQPGVIGSGCPSLGPGNQIAPICDPRNPTATCPAGKSCTVGAGTFTSWSCI
jgi:hypothetical protein